jgi:hypothetical protein
MTIVGGATGGGGGGGAASGRGKGGVNPRRGKWFMNPGDPLGRCGESALAIGTDPPPGCTADSGSATLGAMLAANAEPRARSESIVDSCGVLAESPMRSGITSTAKPT